MIPEPSRRYIRQTALPEIGAQGQLNLRDARVLVVGAGGLGAPLITYLATSGIGHLGIIDPDRVELSNLPRQPIYEEGDIGRLKVEAARDRIAELNHACEVTIYPVALDVSNAPSLIADYDLIADGCDRFATRFLVNEICVVHGIPLVSAAVSGWQGQVMSILPGSPCYRCLVHPEAADERTCDLGILAPFAGQVGSMQTLEVLRVLLGFSALAHHLAILDGKTGLQRWVERRHDPACPICRHSDHQ